MTDEFNPLISTFINDQVPEFVRQQHPIFVEYLKTFYEFMEEPTNPVGRIRDFNDLRDIDTTTDEFFPQFKSTYLSPFPETFLADRSIVVKYVKDFYSAKGSIESIRALFRILYGEEISISLPKLKILRASDGKWQQNISIFVTQLTGDPFEFEQGSLVGQTSGATAEVDLVETSTQGSYTVYQLFLVDFEGTFDENEIVKSDQVSGLTATVLGVVRDVTVTNAGDDYAVGDTVVITHPDGVNATAEVSSVDATNPVVSFVINDGGDDYQIGDTIDFSENGGNGVGAVAEVDGINITNSVSVMTTIILPHQNVVLSTVASTTIQDFATFETIETGEITSINILDGGKFYPDVTFEVDVVDQTPTYGQPAGTGAVIGAVTGNTGRILDIEVTNAGVGYNDTAVADLTGSGDGLATGTPVVNGGPLTLGGFYRNTDGHLSSDMRLQDNVFWQNYSYVIHTEQNINDYRDIVKATTHPAGYALFGDICLLDTVDNPMKVSSLPIDKCIVATISNPTSVEFLEDHVDVLNWAAVIPCPNYTNQPITIGDFADHEISFYGDVPIEDLVEVYSDPCYRQNISYITFSTT